MRSIKLSYLLNLLTYLLTQRSWPRPWPRRSLALALKMLASKFPEQQVADLADACNSRVVSPVTERRRLER